MRVINSNFSDEIVALPKLFDPVPVCVLVKQVYDSAQPSVRIRMLSLMIGKAYAASPPQVRKSFLENLIGSVGVLSLVKIAGGVFKKIRLRGHWPEISVVPDDLRDIGASDVIALVDTVQRTSSAALPEAIKIFTSSPDLVESGSVSLLATIILRRVPDRRTMLR